MITITPTIHGRGLLELEIKKGRYADGSKRLALVLVEKQSVEPLCLLTVNLPERDLEPGEFFVKTWGENEVIAKALLSQTDLFEDTGRNVMTGFVEAGVWRFKHPETLERIRNFQEGR